MKVKDATCLAGEDELIAAEWRREAGKLVEGQIAEENGAEGGAGLCLRFLDRAVLKRPVDAERPVRDIEVTPFKGLPLLRPQASRAGEEDKGAMLGFVKAPAARCTSSQDSKG